MDEANVFLFGIISRADERLTVGVGEQRANAAMLRTVSIAGAILIIVLVAGVTVTVSRYTGEIQQARDEVSLLANTLEERVVERTADLAQSRDRAEVLLAEVNHRVANSLALVVSLVKLQSNAVTDAAAKEALAETQARIFAISLIHKRLYSSDDVRFVALDEYLSGLIEHLETSMRAEGHGASIRYQLEPLQMRTDRSVNLAMITSEWITNAFKYAYPRSKRRYSCQPKALAGRPCRTFGSRRRGGPSGRRPVAGHRSRHAHSQSHGGLGRRRNRIRGWQPRNYSAVGVSTSAGVRVAPERPS